MQFTQKTLTTLEFDKVLDMLAECAPTQGAKIRAKALVPATDAVEITRRLSRTTDARRLCDAKGMPPFSSVNDIADSCERAEKGAMLSPKELLEVARILRTARAMQDYHRTNKTFSTSLDEVFDRLLLNRTLEEGIGKAILSEDMIADEASRELAEIRRKIRDANNKIKDILQHYVSGSYAKALQENIVTVRNGRYVVPVKAECKNDVKGLIHDTSASGATIFVEPIGVVEANNELRMLQSKEEHEIEKILFALSALVSTASESLRLDYYNLTELAFYFACGELSARMKGSEPLMSTEGVIALKKARHPLIDPKKVVPINLELCNGKDTLVITGPNTGGKTVTLKTIGLLSIMAQSGLHIPAEPESSLRIFENILVDIGDEQSIEQSLSTFSSHMVNLVRILKCVNDRSLCLFDELGAGTDPVEGAALAVSVVEEVRSKGAICAATTHYTELKTYALNTEGVVNASCEFDVATLKPTYRLIIGTPGKSNAFAISEKLGLPLSVIDRAQRLVETDHRQFEDVIEQLEAARQEAEKDRSAAEQMRADYERRLRTAEADLAKMKAETEREIKRNKEQAQQMLDSARATSNFIYEQLEKAKKAEEAGRLHELLEENRRAVRSELRNASDKINPVEHRNNENYVLPRPLAVGDKVFVVSIGQEGTVLELPDKNKKVLIQAGSLKTRTDEKNLQLVEEKKSSASPKKKSEGVHTDRNHDFKDEIDLRGLTGDEAWLAVDRYIDQAMLAGFSKLRLIHGKGTGALKNALWQYLKRDKRIATFRIGSYGEGDGGVTVIELK